MNSNRWTRGFQHLVLVLAALAFTAGPAFALLDVYMVAKEHTKTLPDGTSVTMWGYALDPDGDGNGQGDCYQVAGSNAVRAADPACTGLVADSPGPRLTAAAGDNQFRIFLTNLLPEPTSIVVPGQEMPWSNDLNGPTWTNGAVGDRGGDDTLRVRSLGREAAPNGGRRAYRWTRFRSNPIKDGTFLYRSGTYQAKQVPLGLYGAFTQDSAAGTAYGTPYASEVVLLYSELDPAVLTSQTAATPRAYQPRYFLLNGQPAAAGAVPVAAGLTSNQPTLLRFLNAGLESRVPTLVGLDMQVLAEDGNRLPAPGVQYSVLLAAGKTLDAVVQPTTASTHALFDRRFGTTNPDGTTGGMMSQLQFNAPVP